ncbi:DUF2252 family protein [Pedobacter sp. AW1-32]|uniref:DUF2252 family protein n=1 Tax=Pedobacter sp. AW1-32 TaxID=3383026 RepID=UPI003FEDF229
MRAVTKKIFEYNKGRKGAIAKLKYQAMCENAFRFFRGSCHLFYENLNKYRHKFTSPVGWICGDLHLENFGSFRGNNQLTYFDLNDFDESLKAPILWEVARVVTSIMIAFQVLEVDAEQGYNMAALFLYRYRQTLITAKAQSIEPRTAKGIVRDFLDKASHSSAKSLLKKRTIVHKKRLLLNLRDERHFKLGENLKSELKKHLKTFIKHSSNTPYNYTVKDVVYRVAGTGSLGQRRYLFLLKHKIKRNDYILLDMKEAYPSSLERFHADLQPKWDSQAQRITAVQQRMQHVTAAMLDSTIFKGRDYIIQELQPVKDTIKFKLIKNNYRNLIQVINDMAVLTASAQLRSAGVLSSCTIDELSAFAREGGWEDTILEYAQQACAENFRNYYDFRSDWVS